MAWKRGVSNNLPGAIRSGHIKEFQIDKTQDVSASLRIVSVESLVEETRGRFDHSALAYICTKENGLPLPFHDHVSEDGVIYLYAHQYPRCIVTAKLSKHVPPGAICMTAPQMVNSRVCVAELQSWTVYAGESTYFDCREAALGASQPVHSGRLPPVLHSALLELGAADRAEVSSLQVDTAVLASLFAKSLCGCIVSTDEVFVVAADDGRDYIGRLSEVFPECGEEGEDDGEAEEMSAAAGDSYRGVVDESTRFFFDAAALEAGGAQLLSPPVAPPSHRALRDIVSILCSDNEEFPVKRKLLRPCLALTAVVQSGKGKYKDANDSAGSPSPQPARQTEIATDGSSAGVAARVDVDGCTFDRVLLYLEHTARGDRFVFDPLLAVELRSAALTLGLQGLVDQCDAVLGSFQERVRRTPIRLAEVERRNNAGRTTERGREGETLLLLAGMVLDVTRWLEEHPGGSAIIPRQALNVDCSVFFEIYHSSRQSFLYLKEFYIGELALEDREKVSLPRTDTLGGRQSLCSGQASPAFLEQLERYTAWRLDIHQMPRYEDHKSF